MEHTLTVNSQCDETKPNCRKCQLYGISCDYSVVHTQSSRSTDISLARDMADINVIESSLVSMSLSDLGSRVDQALKLAGPSDQWPAAPRGYVHSKTLESLHHFV